MRCTRPRTVGFYSDGKTISWSQKTYSKEYPTFQLPCGKCISCRLEYSRQWAIRCMHEAQMYENNSFITLTYANQHLVSDKLYYVHFQLFIKRLRKQIFDQFLKVFGKENWKLLSKEERKPYLEKIQIGVFVTGEYGEKEKRPHWHAIIFNWRPNDTIHETTNHRGDKIYSSRTLGPYTSDELEKCHEWEKQPLWTYGKCEIGSVTFESAGYVARYAAKKLVHGNDQDHEYHPVSKKSNKQAIGKRWLEKYWPDVFNYGYVELDGENVGAIPRYYEKWLQKNQPQAWEEYVTKTKQRKIEEASKKHAADLHQQLRTNYSRGFEKGLQFTPETTRHEAREVILESNFKNRLQKNLKL